MKKVLLFFCFVVVSILSFSQSLHKGNLLGLHIYTPSLKEGITKEAYVDFLTTKAFPAYEKAFTGLKMYAVTSLRGQDSSSMGLIYMFNNEADRNKYFNNDGTMTEAGRAAGAKLSGIGKEFEKYENSSNTPDRYNDWLVH